MVKRIGTTLSVLLWGCMALHGQEIKLEGKFVEDSLKIGEVVRYGMRVSYPLSREIIFPDSTFSFAPFEYVGKKYFPTKVEQEMAIDSVVYELTTFEIDPIQSLQIPVFLLSAKDSIRLSPLPDSIFLQQLIPVLSDTLEVIANTRFLDVPFMVNYPYISIGIALLLVVLLIVYFVFGNKIRRKLLLRRMQRDFQKFLTTFNEKIASIRTAPSPDLTELTISVWKKYMENLENRPYTKLTTKELIASGIDENLKDVLKNIDRNIYGHINVAEIDKNFEQLEKYTHERYQLRVEEVRNG